MSEEKKIVKLKSEQLQAVRGGITVCGRTSNCANFSLRAGVAPSMEDLRGRPYLGTYTESFDCSECTHWQRPEGPCELEGQ